MFETNLNMVGNVVALAFCGLLAVLMLRKSLGIAFAQVKALPRPVQIIAAILAVVATVQAQKLRSGGGAMTTPTPTVTTDEIARGYRLVSETNDVAHVYVMPANGVYVGNSHVHGASSSWGMNLIDFGDWSFPFGSNHVAYSKLWWFIDGRIRVSPLDPFREIATGARDVLAMQGASRIWRAACGGGQTIVWENVFVGGGTNSAANLQIVLRDNGDFETWSNEVGRVYARIDPDDWDGDGLANEKDENPLAYDGEFFGIANAMPTNANLDAYYQLDVAAVGALDFATIRVTCDGPSDLGDHVVIARTNQVCHVPLLAGAIYTVESDQPIAYSAVSSEHAHIVTNSATKLTVSLPLEFEFEQVQTRGGSDSYVLQTRPIDVGASIVGISGTCCSCEVGDSGFTWTCSDGCQCQGYQHDVLATLSWGGYARVCDVGTSCPCQTDKKGKPQLWMSLNVPEVVFLGATNYVSTLSVVFDPPTATNGVLTLRCICGGEKFSLRGDGGAAVSLPCQWNAEMFEGASFSVEGVTLSDTAGDIAFELEYNEPASGVHVVTQSMTVVRVAYVSLHSAVAGESANPPPFDGETQCPFSVTNSPNPDRHLVVPFCNVVNTNANFAVADFSVGMVVELSPSNAPTQGVAALWSVLSGTPQSGQLFTDGGPSAEYRNPKVGGVYRFSVSCNGSPATECNLVLPLSGASVDAVVQADLVAASNMVDFLCSSYSHRSRQWPWFGKKWFVTGGMGDYLGRVDCKGKPTVWCYNQVNDNTGMGAVATWCGLPVRMAKISNFMVGYATTGIDVRSIYQDFSQSIGNPNDETAQMSWDAGVDVAHGTNLVCAVGNFVTNAWRVSDIKERRLWPNLVDTDNHTAGNVITNFNYQFVSPGFIEKGRTP